MKSCHCDNMHEPRGYYAKMSDKLMVARKEGGGGKGQKSEGE